MELPQPSPEALEEAPKRRRSRGGRGRGGRGRAEGAVTDETIEAVQANQPEVEAEAEPAAAEEPKPRTRRAPRRAAAAEQTAEAPEPTAAEAPAVEALPEAEPAPGPRPSRRRTTPRAAAAEATEAPAPAPADGSSAQVLQAIAQQSRQIEQLIRLQEDSTRRPNGSAVAAAPPARVGVFVDAANIELACDRMRARFDWGKVLRLLTHNRQLVRAIAYSPIHDDPGVSIETQRFVEPFLDKGFKVVTKALKRFQDGTIKANVDIELALDVITMLDRLDVVCLVSGDGDFQRLVEVVQSKGVRVEVVAVGSSTASQLRHAADEYIDLQARLRDVRA